MELEEMRHCARRFALIGGAVRAGIVDAVDGGDGCTAEDVASRIGGDLRAVRIVLDGLTAADVLEWEEELYRLTETGRRLLPGGGMRYTTLHGLEVLETWLTLPEVVRTGSPVESEERYDGGWEVFIGAMGEKSPEFVEKVVDACLDRKPGAESVLDIGGGPGDISLEFASRGLDATMLDREPVIEMASEELRSRVDLVPGDFTESLPDGPFDIAYLGNITHIYGPMENRALFRQVNDSLSPGGVIAINDFVRGMSPRAELFAVNMLVNTAEGGTWTLKQFRDWLTGAGFERTGVEPLNGSQLVFADKS